MALSRSVYSEETESGFLTSLISGSCRSVVGANRRVVVVHDPLELAMVDTGEFDVILHGHTHRQTISYEADRLTFNPGECAGHMSGFNAIGVLDLSDLSTEILNF